MKLPKILKIIFFILACEFVGVAGAFFTVGSIPGWYAFLNKPALNPPNWIFGPVWTILYALMGISLFLVWEKSKNKDQKNALRIFLIQLFLNAVWTPVFFGLKDVSFALMIILMLWVLIVITIVKFKNISKTAASLLVPYLLWVTFATYLNFSIMILN